MKTPPLDEVSLTLLKKTSPAWCVVGGAATQRLACYTSYWVSSLFSASAREPPSLTFFKLVMHFFLPSTPRDPYFQLAKNARWHSQSLKLFLIAPRLELWPGYTTSIMPYETEVLLSADVSHKVLRQTTVLEYLYELYNSVNQREFHSIATKKLVGQIILTRYCLLIADAFKVPMIWNFRLLFYSIILKSMILWFVIFEFGLQTSAYKFFLELQKLANSSQNVQHSVRGQNMQISTVDVIRCVKPSTHYSIWG